MSVHVRLGATELSVSPICFGTWQVSPWWGNPPQEPIVAAMRRAFEMGINFFDTADAYGNGASECVVGRALAPLPRDQIVVATKVFNHFYPDGHRHGDLSRQYILDACDASLQRLAMDHIDLYQCHSFDPLTHPEAVAHAMDSLVRQGKIRAYGVSNWSVEQMRLGHRHGRFASCQPPYSLLNRDIERDVLPYCQATDTGVLVYSPLHRGLLSGKYGGDETFADLRDGHPDFTGERFRTLCDRVRQAGPIAERHDLSIPQLVLAATLTHPAIHCAIVGIKNPGQIEEAMGAMNCTIGREDWYKVRETIHA